MSTNSNRTSDEQDIDLRAVSRGIGSGFQRFNNFLFSILHFFVRNALIVFILIVVGAVFGYFLDRDRHYDHRLVVMPNYESVDYLYGKIDLLNAKIKEGDTMFLKEIGIQSPKKLKAITVSPILDIYKFLNNNELNFRIFEVVSSESDVEKAVTTGMTSKNYPFHMISFSTVGKTTDEKTIEPLLRYLNNSTYYKAIQKEFVANTQIKLRENAVMISQIDSILNQVPKESTASRTGIYNNENSQLNDIIDSKDKLIREQGQLRISLLTLDEIVKKNSVLLNLKSKQSGGMILTIPLLFIGLFIAIYLFVRFYRKQSARLAAKSA